MIFKEKNGWSGTIIIKSNKKGIHVIENRITNIALTEIIKALYDDPDMQLKHVAIGTGTKKLEDTDTTLETEIYRVPFVQWSPLGYGQTQALAILKGDEPDFAPYNGEANIREIGFFAGSGSLDWDGGSGKDTGLMISRILVTRNKELGEQYQITRLDQIDRS
jgi:hypothetical protein